jgi:hypothetical protein
MTATRWWIRLLLRLYPADFREEMGAELVETYAARAGTARGAGRIALAGVWLDALADSLRNGLGERLHPAVGWRRSGNWGRDAELVLRRLWRAPLFSCAVLGTLTIGLGAFAVVYTVVHQVLIAPLPYPQTGRLRRGSLRSSRVYPRSTGDRRSVRMDVVDPGTLGQRLFRHPSHNVHLISQPTQRCMLGAAASPGAGTSLGMTCSLGLV